MCNLISRFIQIGNIDNDSIPVRVDPVRSIAIWIDNFTYITCKEVR